MNDNRAKVINSVRNPLGFLVFATLVGESVLGVLIKTTQPPLQTIFAATFIVYLFGVSIAVIVIQIRYPGVLRGESRATIIVAPSDVHVGDSVVTIAPKPQSKTIIANQKFIMWSDEMYQYTGHITDVTAVNVMQKTCTIASDGGRFQWRFEWLVKLQT